MTTDTEAVAVAQAPARQASEDTSIRPFTVHVPEHTNHSSARFGHLPPPVAQSWADPSCPRSRSRLPGWPRQSELGDVTGRAGGHPGRSAWRDCGRDAGSGHRRVRRGQVDPASALPPQPEDRPNLARRAQWPTPDRRQAAHRRSPQRRRCRAPRPMRCRVPSASRLRTWSRAGWGCLETAMWCSTAADRKRRRAPGWRSCSSAEGSPGSVPWPADWKAGASADFRWNASPLSPLLKMCGSTTPTS